MSNLFSAPTTPRLLVVADLDYAQSEERLLAVIDALRPLASDPRVALQLRAKSLASADLMGLAHRVRQHVPGEMLLILNGPPGVATQLGYSGAHTPEAEIPERRTLTPGWQSAAVHSVEALQRAERSGMDAVVFGSVYAPGSKPGDAAGLHALREVCDAATIPVLAIGGLTPDRVADCIDAGAHGAGVVSGILAAPDVLAAAREYLDALDAALDDPALVRSEANR